MLDDRLQTPCDKSGKHDCRCEEEDGSPPSRSIRPNGERKRRRSLPCGPSETTVSRVAVHPSLLTSVRETTMSELKDQNSKFNFVGTNSKSELPQREQIEENSVQNNNNLSFDNLEHSFKAFSIQDQDGNVEKKCKSTADNPHQLKVNLNL